MNDRPTTASLRRLLERVLVTDSQFEAFCLDYFPTVAQRLASGNDRVQKLSMLLRLSDGQKILSCLREAYPDAVAKYETLLRYETSPLEQVGYRSTALLLFGIVAALALAALAVARHRAQTITSTASESAKSADGGVGDLSHGAVDLAADGSRDQAAANGLPTALPMFKILTPRQRKDATKLTAPLSSVEKFFQNAIDLGQAAELVTYKKIDPAQRQWITHVVLVDGRNQQPVSMIIYSEAQYRAWETDLGSIGEVFRGTLVKIEAALSEIAEYRIASEEFLLKRTKQSIEDAWIAHRFQNYAVAIRMAKAIADTPGETPNNRAQAWQIVAASACRGRIQPDLRDQALKQLDQLSPALKKSIMSLCGARPTY